MAPSQSSPERNESPGAFSEDASDVALLAAAKEAASKAYVPYSDFPVGAAFIAPDGSTVGGCNVENASFGLTNCAERSAVFRAVSQWGAPLKIDTIAIVGLKAEPCWPCGACRQVLNEFGCMRVIVEKEGKPFVLPFEALLPYSFGPSDLEDAPSAGTATSTQPQHPQA